MTLHFQKSNYIDSFDNIETQHFFTYHYSQPQIQTVKIRNCQKITIHMWGAGGGGGYGYGGGGGSGFTILDFPYYPMIENVRLEIQVGKGGSGGNKINNQTFPAEDGGTTTVRIFIGDTQEILKEFVCYGGKAGQDYFDSLTETVLQLKSGGSGGMNTLKRTGLMNSYYTSSTNFPNGGNDIKMRGDDTMIYYLSVSGAGGGANLSSVSSPDPKLNNSGGSFLFYPGGNGYVYESGNTNLNIGGGGASSYFGKGGNSGQISTNSNGGNGDENSGAGGGGGSYIQGVAGKGGDGGHGGVLIEFNGGSVKILP